MKKMIKRADGSYSQRGLWDNIRANKGSGKKPTKEMLKQEAKIKSKMKLGGDWMESSKELKFGGPTKPKKYQTAGPNENDENNDLPITRFTVSQINEPIEKEKPSRGGRGTKIVKSGKSFGNKDICIGKGCNEVIAAKGNPITAPKGKETESFSTTPRIDRSRIVYQTEEERQEGLANVNKYKQEGEARMERKRQEALFRSGRGDFSFRVDPDMKDKGNLTTKFYTRKQTGGKRKFNKI